MGLIFQRAKSLYRTSFMIYMEYLPKHKSGQNCMTNAKNKPSYKLIKLQRAVPHEADLAEVYQTYEPGQNAIAQPFISPSLSLFI